MVVMVALQNNFISFAFETLGPFAVKMKKIIQYHRRYRLINRKHKSKDFNVAEDISSNPKGQSCVNVRHSALYSTSIGMVEMLLNKLIVFALFIDV